MREDGRLLTVVEVDAFERGAEGLRGHGERREHEREREHRHQPHRGS